MTEPVYLDDLQAGQVFGSGTVTVDAAMIHRFAAEFDPQPFHLDDVAAQAPLFRGLAASGWHTARPATWPRYKRQRPGRE